jgi:UDP-N-acetylmuramoyl-tripeptide--D-alanyl-D-alanine ligase
MGARVHFDMDVRAMFDPEDLARWCGGEWRLGRPVSLRGFSIDSRTVLPDHLFVAIRGTTDGHAYLPAAIGRGASSVLIDDPSRLTGLSVPALLVTDTRRALMAIAAGYRQTLACRMVAVTGSVGKTTVKELIADMLNHVGITARTQGNWNNDLGMPLSLLTAEPDAQFGVFEVGMNHPGELEPLCDVLRPDVSVVTCVGPVHLEHFANETGIADEKAAVYRSLHGSGIAVINADDSYADVLTRHAAGNRIVTVSQHQPADYRFCRIDPAHGIFEVHEHGGETITLSAALPGAYFVLDAVLAAAVARQLGVGWPVIQHAIQHYRPLIMRWNRHQHAGIHLINDAYNANPVSMRAAVQAFLEEPVTGSRWLVLGGMRELGPDEKQIHHDLGAYVAGFPSLHVVPVGERGGWIAEGAQQGGIGNDRLFPAANAAAAAAILHEKVHAGDAVLLKGSRGEAVETVWLEWKKRMEVNHAGN